MEIRKVEPVDFEFDMIFVNLMGQEPLVAAEKLLYAFMDAMRRNERLLEDIELNIPDTHGYNVPGRLLFEAIGTLKTLISQSKTEIDGLRWQLKLRGKLAKQLQKDSVQAMKDLFGVLDARQIAKLQKAIDEVRESMKGK